MRGGDSMKDNKPVQRCCICAKEFVGFGNNPYPLKSSGRCCDECNKKVVKVRIEEAIRKW